MAAVAFHVVSLRHRLHITTNLLLCRAVSTVIKNRKILSSLVGGIQAADWNNVDEIYYTL